jgi:hypothetical protein
MRQIMAWLAKGEEGHAMTVPPLLAAAAGAIVLAIGAANDSGVTAIIGGIVLAVGIVAASVADHMVVDYDLYARIDKLEGKK